jgi:hypothetical protein
MRPKLSKKILWLIIIFIPLAIVLSLYVRDSNLDVYINKGNGTLVYHNKVYQSGNDTKNKYYLNGERQFELEELIGKTNNSHFFGFKESVYKIKGKSIDDAVFLKGLMFEGVYQRL